MIGASLTLSNLKVEIYQAATTDIPTIVVGETGTGKKVVAAYLHQHSERTYGEFVAAPTARLTRGLPPESRRSHDRLLGFYKDLMRCEKS